MNVRTRSAPRIAAVGRIPFSSISLLLFASAVVLISIMILFGYIDGVFDSQSGLEESLQAVLTEESAVELLADDMRNGSIADFSMMPSYRIDRQTTSFQVTGIQSAPPEELVWRVPGDSVLQVLPLEDALVVLSDCDGSLSFDILSLRYTDPVEHLADIQMAGDCMLKADALATTEGVFGFVLFSDDGDAMLAVAAPDGSVDTIDIELPASPEAYVLTAGFLEDSPAVAVSDGSSSGILLDLGTSRVESVSSPGQTVPVFTTEGTFFGDTTDIPDRDGEDPIVCFFQGDFTADGNDDLVFVRDNAISIYDSGRRITVTDSIPEGRPVAWGTAEARGLLSARWLINGTQERWRIYIDGRFTDSPGPEFLPLQWRGRIAYSRNSMLGSVSDSLARMSENTGEFVTIASSGSSLICDVDGIGPDVVHFGNKTVMLLLNPLEGNGLHLTLQSTTRGEDGKLLLQGSWDLMIFGSGQDKRVRWERSA
jgi:hypothetical protein